MRIENENEQSQKSEETKRKKEKGANIERKRKISNTCIIGVHKEGNQSKQTSKY